MASFLSYSAPALLALTSLANFNRTRHPQALDFEPEEAGSVARSRPGSLRARLHHLVAPSLRLALHVAAAFPDSEAVRSQAVDFVRAHAHMALRVMANAVETGERGATHATRLVAL